MRDSKERLAAALAEKKRRRENRWLRYARDPRGFAALCWPRVRFYDRQWDVIDSVLANDQTVVVAAHQVGKDFVGAFVVLWFFLTRHPVRVVTTSVKDDHLRVLWSEIARHVDSSAEPLTADRGGQLVMRHKDVRKVVGGRPCPLSYCVGMVSEKGEGMQGHHAPHTLFVVDEASGVADVVFERAATWAKKTLVVGNPYGQDGWFYQAVKGGDIKAREQ